MLVFVSRPVVLQNDFSILNRRIEVTPEPHFDASALPFEALTVSEMLGSNQPDLETFLTRVYRCVAHSSPINEKVNALSYFETLCCDTASANVLINSSLMTLFVRMLRASKAPALRVRGAIQTARAWVCPRLRGSLRPMPDGQLRALWRANR